MRQIISILISLLFSTLVFSQNCILNGRITDENGDAIPYASIYISEISKGSMANINGEYSISIPCGEYLVQFQSIGFKAKTINQNITSPSTFDLQLATQTYQLKEVSIDPSKEDIAYNFIRKATAMAEYYKNQIAAYNCKLYVRSFYDPEKIPWIAKKLAPEEDLKEMMVGNITETVVEYSYERPNKVKEKIIASKSGLVDSLKMGSNYININFYDIGGGSIINPLSKNAFQVYDFEHINSFYDGDLKIHKIEIKPKRKGTDLMNGFIYINDGIWNINNVDIEFEQPLAKFKYKQQYNKVSENVWMPTNHKIMVRVSVLGFEVDVNYLATLSDLIVKTDPKIDEKIRENLHLRAAHQESNGLTEIRDKIDESKTKTEQKIESLLNKKNLSKTDGIKIMRLIKKQEREEARNSDSTKSYEINMKHDVEYASDAFSKNDSILEKERNVPLSKLETQIYFERDSLEKEKSGDTTYSKPRSKIEKILSNKRSLNFNNKNKIFIPFGLTAGISGGFNTVDGFIVRKKLFKYGYDNLKGKSYDFTPTLAYASARKTYLGKLVFNSQYNKTKRTGFFAEIGRKTNDFDREEPMTEFGNTITSLFFVENYKRLYQSDYGLFGHKFDLLNGLQVTTTLDYEDRIGLRNYTDLTWSPLDEEYSPNVPSNNLVSEDPSLLDDHKSLSIDAKVSYTPQQFYRYKKGKKELLDSKFPTMEINYRQGLEGVFESDADYQFASFAVKQTTKIQLLDAFRYHLEVGKFISNKSLYFADFKNFNAQPSMILNNFKTNSFKLLSNYRFNTNDFYFEGHLALEDNNLLLKRIPFMRKNMMTEELTVNYLITERKVHYTEIGYGINRIFLIMNAGIYSAFENGNYSSTNFRIGFNFGLDSDN